MKTIKEEGSINEEDKEKEKGKEENKEKGINKKEDKSNRPNNRALSYLFKFKFIKPPKKEQIDRKSTVFKKNIFSDRKLDQIFIKKIKESIKFSSVFEMLGVKDKNKKNYDNISHEFKKYEQRFGFNFSYKNESKINYEDEEEINKVLKILSIPTEKRSFNDVYLIKKYLLHTKIDRLFKDELESKEESIEKLLTFFGLEMNYRLFKAGEELFKVGDSSVYLYLIIQGKIEILKPTPEINVMSGYEYFSFIMDLNNQKEEFLLNLNLSENLRQFDINKNDIDLLPVIYIKNIFQLIKSENRVHFNFEEELSNVNMTLKDLDLNHDTVKSLGYIESKIKEQLPFVSPILLNKYKFIVDKKNKKKLKLLKYARVLVIGNNEFFGESAMGENEKRNATIRVLEDSYLGYLSANLYKTNFFAEKKLAMKNKINFLNTKFFFNRITLKRFDKKYFNLFVYETYFRGTILFQESDPLSYVYFIEEGLVELSSVKTMLEIEIFLRGLVENFKLKGEKNNKNDLNYKDLKSRTKDLEEYLNKTQKSKLLIVGKNESLGIESFFYGIPYYSTAKVISQRAKIFKISTEHLWQILNIEPECINTLKNLVLDKIKVIKNRLFSMNNTKLILIDNKISFNYEYDFNENYGNKQISDEEKKNLKNKSQICKDFVISTSNILTRKSFFGLSPLSREYKKRNLFYKKDELNDINKNRNQLLNDLSGKENEKNEKIKKLKHKMRVIRFPSFEDRWLNNMKNEAILLNKNKNYFSMFKFYNDNINNENLVENYDQENLDNSKSDKGKNELISINEYNKNESVVADKKNLSLDNPIKSPKNIKANNSSDSILPSISNGKQIETVNLNTNKILSTINNIKLSNNYSYSFIGNEKNLIKTSSNSNKNSQILYNLFESNSNKNVFKRNYSKISLKKYNNFYEIKKDYEKKKFKFYNDSELFSYNKKIKPNSIEIINYKKFQSKSIDNDSMGFSNNQIKLKMRNKQSFSRIQRLIKES